MIRPHQKQYSPFRFVNINNEDFMSKIYHIITLNLAQNLGKCYIEYAGKTGFPLIEMFFNSIHVPLFSIIFHKASEETSNALFIIPYANKP